MYIYQIVCSENKVIKLYLTLWTETDITNNQGPKRTHLVLL